MPITELQLGAVLVEAGTNLPDRVSLRPGVLSSGWSSTSEQGRNPRFVVTSLEGSALSTEVEKAGWTYFYMAGEIRKHAFGFDREKRERAAMGRVIEDVQTQNCNCLQVTGIRNHSFLGIPYVSITAHARHIQNGSEFHGR